MEQLKERVLMALKDEDFSHEEQDTALRIMDELFKDYHILPKGGSKKEMFVEDSPLGRRNPDRFGALIYDYNI